MKPVFADTFYFIALLEEHDQHHPQVRAYASGLRAPVVTTRWVLVETANALSASYNRTAVGVFLKAAETSPRIRLIGPSDELYTRGLDLY